MRSGMRPTTSLPRMMLGMVSANVEESCAATGADANAASSARRATGCKRGRGRMVRARVDSRGEGGRLEGDFGARGRPVAPQHEKPFARRLDQNHDDGKHEKRSDRGIEAVVEDEAADVGGVRSL